MFMVKAFTEAMFLKGEVMKRWLLACLSMLCMVALLVGCGSDTAKQGKQGEAYECWFVLVW